MLYTCCLTCSTAAPITSNPRPNPEHAPPPHTHTRQRTHVLAGAALPPAAWHALLPELLLSHPDSTGCFPSQNLPAASPRDSKSQDPGSSCCLKCGRKLPPEHLRTALRQLREAAVAEQEACSTMEEACSTTSKSKTASHSSSCVRMTALTPAAWERVMSNLVRARGLRERHLHPLNRSLGQLLARVAEAAGVPAAEDAASAILGPQRLQNVEGHEWRQLAERAAAGAPRVQQGRQDMLRLATEAAGRAADVAERQFGEDSAAAAHEQLRRGWLLLVLECREQQHEPQQQPPQEQQQLLQQQHGLDAILHACEVLRRHFG